MGIDSGDALVGTWLKKLGSYDLLDGQDNTILGPDTNRGATILDCLDCVFDLEVSTVGGEDGVEQVVTRSYGCLQQPTPVSSAQYHSCVSAGYK